MLTGRIVVNKELVTKDLPLLNTHVDKIEEYKSILKESELVDRSYEGVNNVDLEEINTYLDQEVFYYCKQPKNVTNFYATENLVSRARAL